MNKPKTIGELRSSNYQTKTVKLEMRDNLIKRLKSGGPIFQGIVGYEETVIPSLCNAILSYHDLILLGLRGQAKTKIIRMLPTLLDEYMPIIKGSEINDHPFSPVSKMAADLVAEYQDEVELQWIHRDERFGEKLATPDVTISDLIGDIDPIKAASQRLHYAHEGVIHFGLIPRTNRGVFAINELPDLQPRIQVGLFNIMQEKDIQIRGFPVRIPLDIFIVYTANPEDYTNRGSIITPLKDRIGSQIMTHYPRTIEDGISITAQEAFVERETDSEVIIPPFLRELVEQIAVEARRSEFVDQKSGVSVRMTITLLENLVSNAERRAIITDSKVIAARICDLYASVTAITGKIELVYEGEQEGEINVTRALVGKAVRELFLKYFTDPLASMKQAKKVYADIVDWFKGDNTFEFSDQDDFETWFSALSEVKGLKKLTEQSKLVCTDSDHELATAMEFVLDGLHQHSMLSRDIIDHRISYSDMLSTMFNSFQRDEDFFEE